MNAFILLALQIFKAEAKVVSTRFLKMNAFVLLRFHIFLLGNNRCQNVLISLVEINVLFCLALKPDQNGRVRAVALSVVVVNKKQFLQVLIRPAEHLRVHVLVLLAFTPETKVLQRALIRSVNRKQCVS